MSIKKLFGEKSNKILTATSYDDLSKEVESSNFVNSKAKEDNRFVPIVDFSRPENFAKFGSAEKYYTDAIRGIYNTFPYDGSLYEKQNWLNSASYIENYIFENEYPRFNGYINIGDSYGSTGSTSDGYGEVAAAKEYIFFKGGPNEDPERTKLTKIFPDYDGKANVYDPDEDREANLVINGAAGLTLEFWLKRSSSLAQESDKQVIFDVWNSASFGSSDYGRFRVEVHPGTSGEENQIYVELMSGTSGIFETSLGQNLAVTGSSWHHYAVSAANSGSELSLRLSVDGVTNDSSVTGSSIGLVTGSMFGYVGALGTSVSGTHGDIGWGKLSGSVDEVRYWKKKRTDKDIGRYWFRDAGGGTNTDDANTSLGVYYKFNEGVIDTSNTNQTDAVVLDYSGRLSNGNWVGYSVGARTTGSAMVESNAAPSEYKDPVIYSFNPEVVSYTNSKTAAGSVYDTTNNASIYNSLPSWLTSEDEETGGSVLLNLVQIIAGYFDNLYLQIEALPRIKDLNYFATENKPYPFVGRSLDNMGFIAPELFSDSSIIEALSARDETRDYEDRLSDIKNLIYQNIYNNLTHLYKSKGTEKSFTNLIRCFGVDDELVRINAYSDGIAYELKDNVRYTSYKKKYADFNNVDRFDSTVFQQTASNNPNSFSYISGSINTRHMGTTTEAEVIFPKKFKKGDPFYFATDFVSGSIFGMHEPLYTSSNDTAWATTDRGHFSVYAVRTEEESDDVYFKLTSSYMGVELTSSVYKEVYNNEKWNFAVRVRGAEYPSPAGVTGAFSATDEYLVDFVGVNATLDVIRNEFSLSASVNKALAENHLSANKRIYVGAHREGFTGSVQDLIPAENTEEKSDFKISSTRYWLNYLSDDTIKNHAKDASSFGSESPYWNVGYDDVRVPEIATLALHWTFDNVTSSDAGTNPMILLDDAQFAVEDASSGNISQENRYGWVDGVVNRQHPGVGVMYPPFDTQAVDVEYVYAARKQMPETINSSDMVQVLNQEDDELFTKDTKRPISFFFAVEKSMYQVISDEIIKYFATIKDFNLLVGKPVERYRQKYKHLEKLRNLFFEKVGNVPDLERFTDFYKWFDSSMTEMINELIPASANFADNMRNMVESHILERNKYWTKFPTLELKSTPPEGGTHGINELKYDWQHGHAPVNGLESDNCFWWRERAERSGSLNPDRQAILDTTLQVLNRRFTTPYDFVVDTSKFVLGLEAKGGAISIIRKTTSFGSGNSLLITTGSLVEQDCNDSRDSYHGKNKVKLGFTVVIEE